MSFIRFEGVSKCFRLGASRMLLSNLLKRQAAPADQRRRFYALRDVSFQIREGETVGVIGGNGAGKSTLLSLVAGISYPDEGRVSVDGRVAALLELGSGFHGDLTGKENVFLNSALLGLSRKRTQERYEEIVDFAAIGEFIDQPLRTYSSGMMMRLAFAVAVHIDPAFLIVDEVLAVGDAAFQEKCRRKILQLKDAGKGLLCVSHADSMVRSLCERGIWLDHGRLMMDGPVDDVIAAYEGKVAAGA
jgi:ABC-type polysaccharide/polyol phosphate transport system ATPase subunit